MLGLLLLHQLTDLPANCLRTGNRHNARFLSYINRFADRRTSGKFRNKNPRKGITYVKSNLKWELPSASKAYDSLMRKPAMVLNDDIRMQTGESQRRSVGIFDNGIFVNQPNAKHAKGSEFDKNIGDKGQQCDGLLKSSFTHEIPSKIEIQIFGAGGIILESDGVFKRAQTMLTTHFAQDKFDVCH
jgi:hypothetical protein